MVTGKTPFQLLAERKLSFLFTLCSISYSSCDMCESGECNIQKHISSQGRVNDPYEDAARDLIETIRRALASNASHCCEKDVVPATTAENRVARCLCLLAKDSNGLAH